MWRQRRVLEEQYCIPYIGNPIYVQHCIAFVWYLLYCGFYLVGNCHMRIGLMWSAFYYHADDMIYVFMIVMPLPSRAPRNKCDEIWRRVCHHYLTIPRYVPWKTDKSSVWVPTLAVVTEDYSPRCNTFVQKHSIRYHMFHPGGTVPYPSLIKIFFCNVQPSKNSLAPQSSSSSQSSPSPRFTNPYLIANDRTLKLNTPNIKII